MSAPLEGEVVVDLTGCLGGAYATKMLADAGAEVTIVEPPGGLALRRSSAVTLPPGVDGTVWSFLACSKRSVAADPSRTGDVELVRRLVEGADGVVWSPDNPVALHPALAPDELRALAPGATVMTVTPFGLGGPWARRPATEATLQAMSGGTGQRGDLSTPPVLAGGRLGDWAAGMVAACSYLISRHRRVISGMGELVDLSALEANCLTMAMYPGTYHSIAGRPMRDVRVRNLPGIHAAKDGYVGFMVVTGQQWLDFAAMVEHPEWADDASLLSFVNRAARADTLLDGIDAWMATRTCGEIDEVASLFRIPVAVLGNGETLPLADHLVEHHWYIEHPGIAFLQPDVPYTLGAPGAGRRSPQPPPAIGSTPLADAAACTVARQPASAAQVGLPFAGLRVADFTTNWAGPIVSHILGMFGAEVIKVESAKRPDPLRFNTIKSFEDEAFWEWSPLQHGPNTSKLDLTLDMATGRGRQLALDLIRCSDVVLENFSPRVMEQWGLDAAAVLQANPSAIYVRAPAYGLSGPWRERTGYAQTIEMTAGLAWSTGFADGAPEIPNGPCDPIAGVHALIAALLALEHRRRTGEGMLVEAPMVGGALNVAAELVLEHSAHGVVLQRAGNRSAHAAPQGVYRCCDDDLPRDQGRWVVISVASDEQWTALVDVLGRPGWATDGALAALEGRRAAHDAIDDALSSFCATRLADEVVRIAWEAGVPAAKVLMPHEQLDLTQLGARGWWSTVDHPVTGPTTHGGFPAIFSAGPLPHALHRSPPPTLGQHNHQVLSGILGLSDEEIERLEAESVIGTRPSGGSAW